MDVGQLKFTASGDSTLAKQITLDSIHVCPKHQMKKEKTIPACFDTVLLNIGSGRETSMQGMFHSLLVLISPSTYI